MTLFTYIRRWGFIQFSTDAVNTTEFVRTPNWPVYSALVMIYDAQKVLYFISLSKTCSHDHLCSLAQYALLTYGNMPVQPRVRVKILLKFKYENIV